MQNNFSTVQSQFSERNFIEKFNAFYCIALQAKTNMNINLSRSLAKITHTI